eukprot:6262161-Amphidinium_carterae.1
MYGCTVADVPLCKGRVVSSTAVKVGSTHLTDVCAVMGRLTIAEANLQPMLVQARNGSMFNCCCLVGAHYLVSQCKSCMSGRVEVSVDRCMSAYSIGGSSSRASPVETM